MSKGRLFTSESVTEGHPDKVCDAISDAVLDAALAADPASRVACETLVTTDFCCIAGEITTKARLNYEHIARETIRRIGYCDPTAGFDADTCRVDVHVHTQSPDIRMGVERANEDDQGAGDQGMMFGYATDETATYMPLPIHLAHRLCERLAEVRRRQIVDYLRPDGKSQVTVEYQDDRPVGVTAVVVSTQHTPAVSDRQDRIRADMIQHVIRPVLGDLYQEDKTVVHVNPTGKFEIGGPHGDCGLTGRKIIVDTYGGMGRHGGGAFSGKDPSKVDRSAAYAVRHVAKNIVAAKLARRCEVQVAYAIGVARPVSVDVTTFGTGVVSDEVLGAAIRETFDLRPRAFIRRLNLLRPVYSLTSAYGHFGREGDGFTWEKLDMVDALLDAVRQHA